MSIPLDRLYNHLDGLCNHNVIIYRFFPHGSKKAEDINALCDVNNMSCLDVVLKPSMLCNDQEPLDYTQLHAGVHDWISKRTPWHDRNKINGVNQTIADLGIRTMLSNRYNVYDKVLLVHSEKNSSQVEVFSQNHFEPVYWWSHAAIAADWFRYAEYDYRLGKLDTIKHEFLIYNRAWSGTREYRLKFAEMLLERNLKNYCKTTFSATDSDTDYRDFVPKNPALQITRYDLDKQFDANLHDSNASADYTSEDYQQCGIEVVLETLFDDQRHHLTEKALRPIACGRPFILAATPGSLKYMREYGLMTFDGLIDESYDNIVNPLERLQAIVSEMQRIVQLDPEEKSQLWGKLNAIAQYNRRLFFNKDWQQSIFDEFVNNYNSALSNIQQNNTGYWWRYKQEQPTNPFLKDDPGVGNRIERDIAVNTWLSQHNSLSLSNTAS